MVVNTCASKLVSWFLMPWRMPSIHWQYLKVLAAGSGGSNLHVRLPHCCTVAPFQPTNLDKPRVDFCKAKKLNIVVNPLSQAHTPQRRQQEKSKFLCLYMFLKTKKTNRLKLMSTMAWYWTTSHQMNLIESLFSTPNSPWFGVRHSPFWPALLSCDKLKRFHGLQWGASKHVRTSIAALIFLNENISKHLESRIYVCVCI